jgi:FtsP/CotA-like multicopper oxidase with cupredoxin domain
VAETLFLTDLLLAAGAAISAVLLGLRAAAGRRLRLPLTVTTVFVVARTVVAALLWTGSWHLVSDRVTLALPAAIVPLTVAVAVAGRGPAARIAGQTAAIGVLISTYLAWVPQAPADRPLTAATACALLIATAVLATRTLHWRAAGSRTARLPWVTALSTVSLIAAVTALYVQNQPLPAAAHDHHGVDVATLTGPSGPAPDVRFTLTAAHGTVRLASGRTVDALTFNGTAPGPAIRVRQGQLVEITLINTDVTAGVTVHWHGVDVPNAEDGVPGLTQDPVMPGGHFVYRFVPDRAGTFWYHSHQDSTEGVARGLFGAFLVDPAPAPGTDPGDDLTVFTHRWPIGKTLVDALTTADTRSVQSVEPGRPVRLRLINSSQEPQRVQITGVTHRVTAIDGNSIHQPGALPDGGLLQLAAGGRYDVSLTMPATPVLISLPGSAKSDPVTQVLAPDGRDTAAARPTGDGPVFDPAHYGTPDGTPAPATPTRSFDLVLDNGLGFANGAFTWANTVNGASHPAIPALTVSLGDRVRMRITNRGITDHPMHLHGHRVRVLTRNDVPVTGSPWWTDTLNVAPGESYEISFTADNPGIWMDHCHNFKHAAGGMLWHLAYTGFASSAHPDHATE